MRFAISGSVYPAWDIAHLIDRAKRLGYHGVELCAESGVLNPSISNPLLTDPRRLHAQFDESGIQIAGLSTSIAMTMDRAEDARSVVALRSLFDLAERVGCSVVLMQDVSSRARLGNTETMVRLEKWLRPLGDDAARHGVTLAVENGPTLTHAAQMWKVLDAVDHPAIGCAWDLANALKAGETPATSISVLNSRIQYVRLQRATAQDDARTERALHALAGIGYGGWVMVQQRLQASVDEAEAVLTADLARLRQWTTASKPPTARAAR